MMRLMLFPSSPRQTAMTGFDRISRISLRAIRVDATFATAALFSPDGATAAPSSRAAAFESTINCVSVRFGMFSSSANDSIRYH
jgi:hypothetical protein